MRWWEKAMAVKSYRGWQNFGDVDRRGGLRGGDTAKKIKARIMPGADIGVRIARGLGVSAEWLFDEENNTPVEDSLAPLEPALPREIRQMIQRELERMLAARREWPRPAAPDTDRDDH